MTLVEEFVYKTVGTSEKPVTLMDLLFTRGPQTFNCDAIRVAIWKLVDDGLLELTKDNKVKLRG